MLRIEKAHRNNSIIIINITRRSYNLKNGVARFPITTVALNICSFCKNYRFIHTIYSIGFLKLLD